MASRFDVYALAPARDAGTVDRFLSRFLRGGEPTWSTRGLRLPASTLKEAVAHGLADLALPYVVELEPHDHRQAATFARLAFTGDRKLILGLSVDDDEPEGGPHRAAQELLLELREIGCLSGFVAQDEPPPPNALAFAAYVDALASRGETSGYFRR